MKECPSLLGTFFLSQGSINPGYVKYAKERGWKKGEQLFNETL